MPRPTNKAELLEAAQQGYGKLCDLIDSMTEEEQRTAFQFDAASAGTEAHWSRDKNIKDVLVHLYEWQQLWFVWVQANEKGENAAFLPAPYTWKTYGEMNVVFWEKHQQTTLHEAKEMLRGSHAKMLEWIGRLSEEALFTKKYFTWTGSSNLGSYCISTTSSHYDWAIKKIKKQKKALQG